MSRINLCMIAPEFFPVWGGVGSYVIELIKSLPADVNVTIVTLKRIIPGMSGANIDHSELEQVLGRHVNIHYVSSAADTFIYNMYFQLSCLRNIPALDKKYRFDVLHSHLSHMPDVFLRLFRRLRMPTVVTVHSTIKMQRDNALLSGLQFNDLEASEKKTLLLYPLIDLLQQIYARRVFKFIAVSKITRDLLIKHLGVGANKISIVYNGVNTELFSSPSKVEVERKYAAPTVVYVGRILAKKGISFLINSIPVVLQRFPETRFLLVGGGQTAFYREMGKKKGIPDKNLLFAGHLDYFHRQKILREATVFVNPSLFENCSISILEAMSSEAAVIASNVGGNPELITSGKNGLLVPAADHNRLSESIITLLEDEGYNREIGQEGRRTVMTRFSSKLMAEKTYNIYKSMLKE